MQNDNRGCNCFYMCIWLLTVHTAHCVCFAGEKDRKRWRRMRTGDYTTETQNHTPSDSCQAKQYKNSHTKTHWPLMMLKHKATTALIPALIPLIPEHSTSPIHRNRRDWWRLEPLYFHCGLQPAPRQDAIPNRLTCVPGGAGRGGGGGCPGCIAP